MIFLTQKSYSHAFSNKGALNLNAAENLPELVENSVLTYKEEATHGDINATNVFTFFAAGHDGKNTVPVKLKVKEYSVRNQNIPENIAEYMRENGMMTDYDSVYDSVVLELDEIENDEASSSAAAGFTAHDPSASSTINVADLLRLVNGDARKYIPQLFGVDGEEVSRYNENVTEVRENAGEDQLHGASGEGVREGRSGADTDQRVSGGLRDARRGNLSSSGVLLLSEESKRIIEERGAVYVEVHETTEDRAAFSDALNAARTADTRNGWAVSPKSVEELSAPGMRTFMSDGNYAGFAVTESGDIEGVFSNKSAGAPNGVTRSMMPQAIAAGGNKLDCYGIGLVKLYSKYGFEPVARVPFNAEYANDGWDESKGRPDVVIMIHNGDDADTVVKNSQDYHRWTPDELNALPVFEDYDEAMAYRDKILEERNNSGKDGRYSISDTENSIMHLEQRVSGDDLLNAQDLIGVIEDVGGTVDENGYVTIYHRTNDNAAKRIYDTGRMVAKEDGLFFSTKQDGQNIGYGDSIITLKVPAEMLELNDIFDGEAHLRYPLDGGRRSADVSKYLVDDVEETAGGRFNINENFAAEVDAWDKAGRSPYKTFVTGTTSDAMQSIGIVDKKLIMRSQKMNTIMKQHPEITVDIFKKIPDILEKPFLIMKSRTVENSIVAYGDAVGENGIPVMVSVLLGPTESGNQLIDVNIVTSAYSRTNESGSDLTKDLILNSDILYVNENGAEEWLHGLGVQFPSFTSFSGPIGIVTYENGVVKSVEGIPGKDVFGTDESTAISRSLAAAMASRNRKTNAERDIPSERLSVDDSSYMDAIMQAAEQEEQRRTMAAQAAAQAARQAKAKQREADKAAKAGNRAAAAVTAQEAAELRQEAEAQRIESMTYDEMVDEAMEDGIISSVVDALSLCSFSCSRKLCQYSAFS